MATSATRLLVRFRDADNRFGVTRATLSKLAQELGLTETQVILFALRQLALSVLPAYEADDGPLKVNERKVIERIAGERRGKSVRSSLV